MQHLTTTLLVLGYNNLSQIRYTLMFHTSSPQVSIHIVAVLHIRKKWIHNFVSTDIKPCEQFIRHNK